MSEYPRPTTSNVFNPMDYTQTNPNNNTSDIDTTDLVKRSGDNMTGTLTVPNIRFSDNTQQSTAYDSTGMDQFKTDTTNNTHKLENISRVGDYTFATDLKVDNIQFMNAKQNQAFLDIDKTQIQTNKGRLEGISNTTTDMVLQNRTFKLKDSPMMTIVNTLSPLYEFFDPNIALMRSASTYRKYWLGLCGDGYVGSNPQNTFNICVNGNHPMPESILQLDHNGNLKIKGNLTADNFANTNNDILDL